MAEKRIAQYRQIENDLLEQINLGYYKKGDLIPTELELSATYHVSRVTVLGIEKEDPIYYIHRQRYGDGELLQLETTYMSARLYPDISIQILESSKYQYFEKVKGIKIAYSHHAVTPIHPSKEVAELFGIAQNTPIIKYQLTYIKR